ncbi:MAG: CRISPR-associated ring nuclease [Chloroflexota bacterium]
MATIFMATLGQRPAAITLALDALLADYEYEQIVILHTDPENSGIAESWATLRPVLGRDYDIPSRGYEVLNREGQPIFDINHPRHAEGYYHGVIDALGTYKREAYTIHLLVAGGRKSMSIYATLAASLFFGPTDRLWTVHSSERLVNATQYENRFHAKDALERREVDLIRMPILPNRLLPGVDMDDLLADPLAYFERRNNQREDFLSRLKPAERELVDVLLMHPDATYPELAAMLHKSERTIETQFRGIYNKMVGYGENIQHVRHKKPILLRLLSGGM